MKVHTLRITQFGLYWPSGIRREYFQRVYRQTNTGQLTPTDEKSSQLVYSCRRFFNINWVRVKVFKSTLNNFSVISWQPVLLVEETEVPGENYRHATSQ